MLVLNTISPEVSPSAPKECPSNTNPSANARTAFFMSFLPIRNPQSKSVPYLSVHIHRFPAHPVPVHRHPNEVIESAVFLNVIQRRSSSAGNDVGDAVNH